MTVLAGSSRISKQHRTESGLNQNTWKILWLLCGGGVGWDTGGEEQGEQSEFGLRKAFVEPNQKPKCFAFRS